MSNRKMVLINLLRNSIEAYFAAIEIHNKPNMYYRYETVSLLLINAWELLSTFICRAQKNAKTVMKLKGVVPIILLMEMVFVVVAQNKKP